MSFSKNNEFKPFLWLRYLPDIFGIWAQGSQKLKELFNCTNSLHPTIKFTMDYSTTGINFLGVTVSKVGNKLERDLYSKPTDAHQYLMHNHARSWGKGSIAYGQIVRFTRICSTEEKLNNHLQQFKQWLVKRGYGENHVDSENKKIKLEERAGSFHVWAKKDDDNITLVLTYHPALNQLYEIQRRAHKRVLKSPRPHSDLPSLQWLASRNPKIIRDKLVLSKLKQFLLKLLVPIFVVILTVIYVK